MKTRLSIIIPTYNYANTLPRAIQSVTQQLKPHHELIVVDDGSTDNTTAVLKNLLAESKIPFQSIHKENGGVASARNLAITLAKGDYFIFLDSDDELMPDAFEKIEQHLEEYPKTELIVCGHTSVWPNGKQRVRLPGQLAQNPMVRIKNFLLDKSLIFSNGSCVMHRSVFDRGVFPEHFKTGEDVAIFCQALANHPTTTLQESIVRIHKHDDSLRHQFDHAKAGGLNLVEEVFSLKRLGPEFQHLKRKYKVQRSLSLFRAAYLAGNKPEAKQFYLSAIKSDFWVVFKWRYTKKAIGLWIN